VTCHGALAPAAGLRPKVVPRQTAAGNGNMKRDPSGSPKRDPLPGAAEGAGGHRGR
jgi:hypothetical protein